MYEPNYKLTHTILNNLIKFEIIKTKLEQLDITTSVKDNMNFRTKATNLLHISHLLGINLTLKDAEKIAEGKRLQTEDARGTILTNYRNIIEFIRSSIADSYADIDLNVVMHLNKILLTDWKELWEAKLRLGGEEVDSSYDNWIAVRDKEIDAANLQDNLLELIDWYKSNLTKIHPIIRVAIFIYRFLRISPLMVLNKITVIALADYLLYKNNYLQSTFIPISRNFDIYEDEYIEAWNTSIQGKLNPETGEVYELEDITLWLERFTRNLSHDVLEVREIFNRKIGDDQKSIKQPFLDLNKRQLKILRYLQTIPTVKREDYIQMMDVSTMTAFRDLNQLVKKKLLKIEGKGRGTKYMLSSR